jgi:cytochrome c-type biogenesis protein CcmE
MSQVAPDRITEGAVPIDDLRDRRSRLPLLGLALLAVGALTWLAADAFQESVVYYLTPSEVAAGPGEGRFRLAGVVIDDSLHRDASGTLHFEVTDGEATIAVRLDGRVPDSLEGGAEAVAEGRLGPDGVFEADSVLTRCASKFESELGPGHAP